MDRLRISRSALSMLLTASALLFIAAGDAPAQTAQFDCERYPRYCSPEFLGKPRISTLEAPSLCEKFPEKCPTDFRPTLCQKVPEACPIDPGCLTGLSCPVLTKEMVKRIYPTGTDAVAKLMDRYQISVYHEALDTLQSQFKVRDFVDELALLDASPTKGLRTLTLCQRVPESCPPEAVPSLCEINPEWCGVGCLRGLTCPDLTDSRIKLIYPADYTRVVELKNRRRIDAYTAASKELRRTFEIPAFLKELHALDAEIVK